MLKKNVKETTKTTTLLLEEENQQIEEKDKQICQECSSTNIILDFMSGAFICNDCGLVVESKIIDNGPEWRAYDWLETMNKTRVGLPTSTTMFDKGISTFIGLDDQDCFGTKFLPNQKVFFSRMRKWHYQSIVRNPLNRKLVVLSDLHRVASQLELPRSVRVTAASLYREAVKKDLIRGRTVIATIAACLYASTRLHRVPRSLDEIASITGLTKKTVGTYYRYLVKNLNLTIPQISPLDYLQRFGAELNLSTACLKKAAEILNHAKEKGVTSGRNPVGLAAASLYLASTIMGERRIQKDVAQVAHVSSVTIRNICKVLRDYCSFPTTTS